MANTFDGHWPKFLNRGIHTLVTEILEWRTQVTTRPELKAAGGWNDSLNRFLMEGLEDIADTLERITYSIPGKTQEDREAEAADTSRSLSDDYDPASINSDELLMPPAREYEIAYDLSGSNPSYPQLNPSDHPNAFLRDFVTGLDSVVCETTRLTSRNLPVTVSKNESAMIRARLNELYAICQEKGGEANRKDRPTGTLPTEEPGAVS